jgi:hypothetical protein
MTPKQKFEILTTSKEKKYERAQFKFALLCAERTITKKTNQEINEFFHLVALLRISEDYKSIEHLKDDDYWAAYCAPDWAAYCAADWAAYWAADCAAFSAADWAAYRAADWAADWKAEPAIYKQELHAEYQIADHCWDLVE